MMKNLLFLALIALFLYSCDTSESNDNATDDQTKQESTSDAGEKKYEIESGFIKYKMTMMGMESSVVQYFKDHGNTEATFTEIALMGEKMKNTSLRKDSYIYNYIDGQKTGTKIKLENETVAEGEMAKLDEETILAQGGKKVADEEVLGKKCNVYEIATDTEKSKFWIWKKIVLKMTASQNGMAATIEAIEISETSDFPDGVFDVPQDIEFTEPNLEADFDEEGAKG